MKELAIGFILGAALFGLFLSSLVIMIDQFN